MEILLVEGMSQLVFRGRITALRGLVHGNVLNSATLSSAVDGHLGGGDIGRQVPSTRFQRRTRLTH